MHRVAPKIACRHYPPHYLILRLRGRCPPRPAKNTNAGNYHAGVAFRCADLDFNFHLIVVLMLNKWSTCNTRLRSMAKNTPDQFIRGGQTTQHWIRMAIQVLRSAVAFAALVFALVYTVLCLASYKVEMLH